MKKKILVIEDEAIFCKLISRWLENNGYKVLTAPDGETGLDIIKEDKPDLVLIDTLLPGLDGLQVCREIRLTDISATLPIILMSAIYKDLHFVMQAKKIANDFIEKPFKEIELIRRINTLLPQEDDIIPPSPSYVVSKEAEKSKEISGEMESDLVIEVKDNLSKEESIAPPIQKETQTKNNKITIEVPTHEPEILEEPPVINEKAEDKKESNGEFYIALPEIVNISVERAKEKAKDAEPTHRPLPGTKKSQSIESIQRELDDLFKMTKKK